MDMRFPHGMVIIGSITAAHRIVYMRFPPGMVIIGSIAAAHTFACANSQSMLYVALQMATYLHVCMYLYLQLASPAT